MKSLDAAQSGLQAALAVFRDYPLTDDAYGLQTQITSAMDDAVAAIIEARRLSQEHSDSFRLYSSASMSLMRAYQKAHGMLDTWPGVAEVNAWAVEELLRLRTQETAILTELAKHLTPGNENVTQGDIIASIRDLAQIALTGRENSETLDYLLSQVTADRDAKTNRMWELGHEVDRLTHEVDRLTQENEQLRDAAHRESLSRVRD